MQAKSKWRVFLDEAIVILDDAWRFPLERARFWWGIWFLSALRRKESRSRSAQNLDDESLKGSVITASLQILEIERVESLCRKHNVPTPEMVGRYIDPPQHWYFDQEKRIAVLAMIQEARARRSKEVRGWLLAATGTLGALTGLVAVLFK